MTISVDNRSEFFELALVFPAEEGRPKRSALRSGERCPKCQQAQLDYDGQLNLACPACGFAAAEACFS
jgi:hypothetical protein